MSLLRIVIRFTFGALALAAVAIGYFALSPVRPDNVLMRVGLICNGYRAAARLTSSTDVALAWARYIDCGCMRQQLEASEHRKDVSAMLEALRGNLTKVAENAFVTEPAKIDFEMTPAVERALQTLTLKVAMCQRPFA